MRHAPEPARNATHEDFDAMLSMAQSFVSKAWARCDVAYDEATCAALLGGLINNERGILLITPARDAMMGALVHPWHFNANILTATELFWWADPGAVGAMDMIEGAERLASELGALTFNMACQDHMRSAALGRVYERRGYAASEHVYIKGLH